MKAFQELGYEVFCMPHHGIQGGEVKIDGIQYLPSGRDGWGQDIVEDHVKNCRIDAVISSMMYGFCLPDSRMYSTCPGLRTGPVDSVPVAPKLVEVLREAEYVVAMSRFGQSEMMKKGIESTYIPHAINTDIFRPYDKLEARRELGIHEDKFIALIAAANFYYPSRKAFPEQMTAFAEFHKEFPDSELLLHTAIYPTRERLVV